MKTLNTLDLIDSLAEKFVEDVKANRWKEEGWVWSKGEMTPMYPASKILLKAYSIALAKSLWKSQQEDHQTLLASFAPGLTNIDPVAQAVNEGYSLPSGRSPAQGADTGLRLALLPKKDFAKRHGKLGGVGFRSPANCP